VQTVKRQIGEGAGYFPRDEWESQVPDERLDLSAIKQLPLKNLLTRKLLMRLKPQVETCVQREAFIFSRKQGEIEVTIDQGEVKAAGRTKPLCEVELELKGGAPAMLFDLADKLGKVVPLTLATESKAAQGLICSGESRPRRYGVGLSHFP
jgi:triphosphatase